MTLFSTDYALLAQDSYQYQAQAEQQQRQDQQQPFAGAVPGAGS